MPKTGKKQLSAHFCAEIAALSAEYDEPIAGRGFTISGPIRAGECGEIMTETEIKERYAEDAEAEEITGADGEPYADADAFLDDVTSMGGYFQYMLPAFYMAILRHADGHESDIEDENCAPARYECIEDAYLDASSAADNSAYYDAGIGEYKRPEIIIAMYRAAE